MAFTYNNFLVEDSIMTNAYQVEQISNKTGFIMVESDIYHLYNHLSYLIKSGVHFIGINDNKDESNQNVKFVD